jgi:glycogen synthase
MKVLMFGWEFPPHISGGLGTACFGLTQSLAKEKVQVLFVVPKLHGDEPSQNTQLINASSVSIPQSIKITRTKGREPMPVAANLVTETQTETEVEWITVPSTLQPYQSPSEVYEQNVTIRQWSYELPSSYSAPRAADEEEVEERKVNTCYSFSGTYGANLYEEVNRYADVAAQIAADHTFDIIHAHDWMTYPAGIAAKRISGKPLAVHVHATEFDRSGEQVNPYVFSIEQQGMREADCIVAVSQWTKDIIVKRYGIEENKVHVVHNGIIPKADQKRVNGKPIGSHIVTFLGRITYQKGPQYFVEAAHKVLRKFPDAHFIVAGSGDMLPQMVERAAALKISSRFHFTGFLKGDMIDQVWSMSNVYVMPSVSEPFGIAPLEAIQSGVPVIVSNQSGVAEVMAHAIKVDFWNTDALASAICSVLQYKSLHTTLKNNGEKEIQNITWDKAAKKLNTIYHELVTT